jgi:hypothetical protein
MQSAGAFADGSVFYAFAATEPRVPATGRRPGVALNIRFALEAPLDPDFALVLEALDRDAGRVGNNASTSDLPKPGYRSSNQLTLK